jgi:hypothetical protein
MAIFNSYVKLPEGKTKINHTQIHHKWVVQTIKKNKMVYYCLNHIIRKEQPTYFLCAKNKHRASFTHPCLDD